ncbi:Ubiquitin fusion degradation protein 1 [Sesbania bispinosa]|nr:Ubiquitin fusion degradation protein 1 [Sesbania bispinosa]
MRETDIEMVMVEKEADRPMERKKQRENRKENLGYKDYLGGNKVEVKIEMKTILMGSAMVKHKGNRQGTAMEVWVLSCSSVKPLPLLDGTTRFGFSYRERQMDEVMAAIATATRCSVNDKKIDTKLEPPHLSSLVFSVPSSIP